MVHMNVPWYIHNIACYDMGMLKINMNTCWLIDELTCGVIFYSSIYSSGIYSSIYSNILLVYI